MTNGFTPAQEAALRAKATREEDYPDGSAPPRSPSGAPPAAEKNGHDPFGADGSSSSAGGGSAALAGITAPDQARIFEERLAALPVEVRRLAERLPPVPEGMRGRSANEALASMAIEALPNDAALSPRAKEIERTIVTVVFGTGVDAPAEEWRNRVGQMKTMVKRWTADATAHLGRSANDTEAAQMPTFMQDPEPWPSAVDGAVLLEEIARRFCRYVKAASGIKVVIAAWVLFAHTLDAFKHSPRLAFISPAPECGKTTSLKFLKGLVPCPLPTSNVTAAALFRCNELWQPTLLADEMDNADAAGMFKAIWNSGHDKEIAIIIRADSGPDDHTPRTFSTWGVAALAMIGRESLWPEMASRSIKVHLERMLLGETVERFDVADLIDLKRQCMRWAADNIDALRDADPAMPPEFVGRRADNWRPLFAIADLIGGPWRQVIRDAAVGLEAGEDAQTLAIRCLADLRAAFTTAGKDKLRSEAVAAALGEQQGSPWVEWGQTGRAITANAVAKLLRGFNIQPRLIRFGQGKDDVARGYNQASCEEAFRRYLPPEKVDPFSDIPDNEPETLSAVVAKKGAPL